jgi:hypothetical protein
MREQTSEPLHPVDEGEIQDSLDRRIASLRQSVEREGPNGHAGDELARPQPASGPRSPVRSGFSRLVHARRFEIRVYGFFVAVSLIVAWLISTRIKL